MHIDTQLPLIRIPLEHQVFVCSDNIDANTLTNYPIREFEFRNRDDTGDFPMAHYYEK